VRPVRNPRDAVFRESQAWKGTAMSGAPRHRGGDVEAVQGDDAAAPPAAAHAILFDARDGDREIALPLQGIEVESLRDHQLLWIDVVPGANGEVVALLERLGVTSQAQPYLLRATGEPRANDHEGILHVEVAALARPDDCDPVSIVCLAGKAWVVTAHAEPVPFLADFRERASGGSDLGALDAPSFLARVLEWQLTTYNEAIESIVEQIDELDQGLLVSLQRDTDLLPEMVALRRRVAQLRMNLAPHREVFARLASPELDNVSSSQSAEAFRALSRQVSDVIATVEDTREMLLGSFDILMSRTGQRTNDVMKVLTIASVVILPSTLVAGILGMNFHPGFFDTANLFWAAIGLMALLVCGALIAARRMRWL
jgi:magnesium transporter